MTRKCELLDISRSGVYYVAQPAANKTEELKLCRLLDELHLNHPWMGSRSLRDQVSRKTGESVNRKRIRRLMLLMGIRAVYRRPRTSDPGKGHTIYPYLLRGLKIERANQVWAADITYIPMAKGFLYLVAIIDWYSRKVLSWRLSNSMDAGFCVEALEEALSKYGKPEIFNTDQGAQFTGEAFTTTLKEAGVRISMDGKGRWMDNVFIERLWRSLKYEEVYLKAYESVKEAKDSIRRWMGFYNEQRTHQSLQRQTPDEVYFKSAATYVAA
jgi:putative transposase